MEILSIKNYKKLYLFGFVLLGIAVFFLIRYYYLNDPEVSQEGTVFAVCPFHHITGLHCPGCGSQRAIHDLLHLRIFEAIKHNLIILIVILVLLAKGYAVWSKKYAAAYYYSLTDKSWFTYSIVVVVFVFWVLRNLPFAPFSKLAP
jgi:hypothetical protein